MGRPDGLDPGSRRDDPDLDPSRLGGRRSGWRCRVAWALGALPRPGTDPGPEVPDGAGALLILLLGAVVALQAEKSGPFTVVARLQSFRDFQDLSFRTRISSGSPP